MCSRFSSRALSGFGRGSVRDPVECDNPARGPLEETALDPAAKVQSWRIHDPRGPRSDHAHLSFRDFIRLE